MNDLETAMKMLKKYIVDDWDCMYSEGVEGYGDMQGDVKCVLNEVKVLRMENILLRLDQGK